MTVFRSTLNGFVKDRMDELIFSFDETVNDYASGGSCQSFAGRMGRVLSLIQSYAGIFDICELENFSKYLGKALMELSMGSAVCSEDLVDLAMEARSCLRDMSEAAARRGAGSLSLYDNRARAIVNAIEKAHGGSPIQHTANGPIGQMRLAG